MGRASRDVEQRRQCSVHAVHFSMEGENTPECLLPPFEKTIADLHLQAELLSGSDAELQVADHQPEPKELQGRDLDPKAPADDASPQSLISSAANPNPSTAKVIVKEALTTCTSTTRKSTRRRSVSSNSKLCTEYIVRFKGNQSAKWDGKEIVVDGDWLQEMYPKEELCPGRIVQLPWEDKKGKNVDWRVMIVSVPGKIERKSTLAESIPENKSAPENKSTVPIVPFKRPAKGLAAAPKSVPTKKTKTSEKGAPTKKAKASSEKGKGKRKMVTGGRQQSSQILRIGKQDGATSSEPVSANGKNNVEQLFSQLVQQQEKILDVLSRLVTKQNQQPASSPLPPLSAQPNSDSSSPCLPPPPPPTPFLQQSPQPQLYSSLPIQQVTHSQPEPEYPQQLPQSPPSKPIQPISPPTQVPHMQQLSPPPRAPLPRTTRQLPLQYQVWSSRQLPPRSRPASFPRSAPTWSPHVQPQQEWCAGGSSSNEEALSTSASDEVIVLESSSTNIHPVSLELDSPWTDQCDWSDGFDSDYHTSDTRWYPPEETYSGDTIVLSSSTDTSTSDTNTQNQCVSPSTPPSFNIPPVPFSTPPKLKSVEQVMKENSGTDALSLRKLATALAREAIFGRKEMTTKSLSGRHATEELDRCKIEYIKTLVHSRVPKKSNVEFEALWKQCRGSLSKSCQTLRNTEKKKALYN